MRAIRVAEIDMDIYEAVDVLDDNGEVVDLAEQKSVVRATARLLRDTDTEQWYAENGTPRKCYRWHYSWEQADGTHEEIAEDLFPTVAAAVDCFWSNWRNYGLSARWVH